MACLSPQGEPPPPPPLTPSFKCDNSQRHVHHKPPPPLHTPPYPHTPHCWKLAISDDLGQKRGRPPFRGLKVVQLNLDSFCDHGQTFQAVVGHLEAEIDF
jgi:hypothetical protein